ncbi:hypothetical protein [Niveispirillum cyanobacteriorum]|uniref:hypothetical protein n=1 Tax=Niveispirillum cyanobacteriorum TaxID=1612173 RepID=UPI001319CBB5|nr:hypothetical protein [Niveispirillum cyanobacteriorum]GGE63931.1 hypothetical protein GCM10011317_21640 [Niveispirillum cyanobacteriorum]
MIIDDDNNDDSVILQMGISGYDGTESDYTAQEYHALAVQSLRAAESLDSQYQNPIFILLCHALELSLKSYLSLMGAGSEYLRKNYGHDIEKLLGSCREKGLSLNEDTLNLIEMYFYDFDQDKYNRESFAKLSHEKKKILQDEHRAEIYSIVEDYKNAKEPIPYSIQLFLAYVFDDENAKAEIGSKKYRDDKKKVGHFASIRYRIDNVIPPRISSQRSIREVIEATDPNVFQKKINHSKKLI